MLAALGQRGLEVGGRLRGLGPVALEERLGLLAAGLRVALGLVAELVGLSLLAIPGAVIALAIVAWLCVGIFRSGRW